MARPNGELAKTALYTIQKWDNSLGNTPYV